MMQDHDDITFLTMPDAAKSSHLHMCNSKCNQQVDGKHLSTILSKYQERRSFCGSPVGAEELGASPAVSTSCSLCTNKVCKHQNAIHISYFTATPRTARVDNRFQRTQKSVQVLSSC